jgi:Protein of unknown function (DUF2939)
LPDNSSQPAANARRRIVVPIGSDQRSSNPTAGRTSRASSPGLGVEPAARPRSSRVLRVLGILAVLAVVIVVLVTGGIFFWWQQYKTKPAYSLAVLINAAHNNDLATVRTIIDTDQVVKNLTDEVTDKAAGRYGVALGTNAREQIQALGPTFMPRMKGTIDAALLEHVKGMSEGGDRQPFILLALAIPRTMNIAVSDDNNSATVQVPGRPGKFEMSHAGGNWKVVAFRDDALVQRVIDQVIKELPAIGVRDNHKGQDDRKRPKGMLPLRIQ